MDKKKSVPAAAVKSQDDNNGCKITLDFEGCRNIMDDIRREAEEEFREPSGHILWILREHLKNTTLPQGSRR